MLWVTITTVKLARKVLDQLLDLGRGQGIEGGTGLIHQQDFRLHGQGAGDAEALLLAAGQG